MQRWRQIGRLLKAFLLCLLLFFFFFFLKFDRFAFLKRKCGTLSLGKVDTSALFQLFISQLDESASILSFGIDSVKCVLHFLINIPHFLLTGMIESTLHKDSRFSSARNGIFKVFRSVWKTLLWRRLPPRLTKCHRETWKSELGKIHTHTCTQIYTQAKRKGMEEIFFF